MSDEEVGEVEAACAALEQLFAQAFPEVVVQESVGTWTVG